MQNKANFQNGKMNTTLYITGVYKDLRPFRHGKNKAKTNPNKANFQNSQMNVSSCLTMSYEQKTMKYENKNKAKTNPTCPELVEGNKANL